MAISGTPGVARAVRAARKTVLLQRIVTRARLFSKTRTVPISKWGWERGTPIDRYYIDCFLRKHSADVHGRVLEVKEDRYSSRFGADSVEVVDIDETNAMATIVGDLCDARTLPAGAFDAAVVTQTLQFVADPRRAATNILRSLRPGGTLLLTLPCTSRVGGVGDRWRWTAEGAKDAFGDLAPTVDIDTDGNVAVCRAFLMGLATEELSEKALAARDPDYPLLVTLRLVTAA